MHISSLQIKIFLVSIIIIIFVAFNSSRPPEISQQQLDYETWLSVRAEEILRTPESEPVKSKIELELNSLDPNHGFTWRLFSSNETQRNQNLVRLLQLIGESKLLGEGSGSSTSPISLKIIDGNRQFATSFDKQKLADNLAAQSFLKLFQIYSEQNRNPAAVQALKNEGIEK